MRTTSTRAMLAVGALAWTTSIVLAAEPGLSSLEQRFRGWPRKSAVDSSVRQAAHQPEMIVSEEGMPDGYGEPYAGESHGDPYVGESYGGPAGCPCESYGDAGCYDGGCYDGGCYDGGCYDGGCYDSGYCYGGGCQRSCCPCGNQHCRGNCGCKGMFYSEVQLMAIRPHVLEDTIGKLEEKYEFSPRFIMGYEAPSGLGVRGRYWTYDRTTETLDENNALSLDFEVVDFEGTSRFRTSHADLIIAGGFRWAGLEAEVDGGESESDMIGITLAADLRSVMCRSCRSEWAGVCGARWSLLGGDWESDGDALIVDNRDDNINVQEIYGGFEYVCCCRGCSLYTRVVFEVQNWHSDALGDDTATDSIGFIGPGLHAGVTF